MKRAVRAIIRLTAAGLSVLGGMEIGLEWVRHRMHKADISLWHYIFGAVLIGLGVLIFAASASLAERLTDDFDE
jgi:hypothetical protein